MQMIAGKDGIGGATTAMESFATQIGNAIYGIGVLTKAIKSIPGAGFIGDVLSAGTQISGIGLLSRLGASSKARSAGTPAQSPGQRKAIDKANADAIKLQKTKNTLSKIDNDNTSRKLVLTGDQLALLELEKKFDVERIGLFAAMNQATDSETKMRLLSLIAIKDQNAALAGQIMKANQTTDALEAFRQAILASIKALLDKVKAELAALQALVANNGGGGAGASIFNTNDPNAVSGGMPGATADSFMNGFSISDWRAKEGFVSTINYNINAQGIGDQQIAAVVQNAIQDLNRYGSSTTYAGAI
jgi:hypothetical protein